MQNFLEIVDIILKLILAVLCGGLIGVYRGDDAKFVGMPYTMLVSLTSALFVVIASRIIFVFNLGIETLELVTAPIIIGFAILGSAIVIGQKGSLQSIVQALTLWIVAGVGLAIGSGLYLTGVCAGVISFIVLNIIYKFMFTKT
jgi:putative Mg2+ transporter-C (MgtC) family protein